MPLFPPDILHFTTQSHFSRTHSSTWIVYLFVLLFITAGIISLPFISIEVSTQSRGIIRTQFENNQLQSAVYAQITDIRMVENQPVIQGDTLLVLNADNINVQINRALERVDENIAFISDISFLLDGNVSALQTPKYLHESNLFRASENEHQTRIAFLQHELYVSERLHQRDAIAQNEYLRDRNNYDNALRSLDNLREQFRNRWQAERTAYEQEIGTLRADILRLLDEKTKYVLLAPVSGSIMQLAGIHRGSFIAPGQVIAQISNDNDLLVESFVSPADIGFVNVGQPVRFQLDAFNYNQWGMAHGTVKEISSDIVTVGGQPVFRVRSSLDNDYLQLRNGYQGNLTKGMTLTARFYLTERTLWQLLFDRVDKWLNPAQN
ncbi:MAG: HlyD family efflux transporter periplasmic adaptor subunit [Dysgonamonadaceae bacterium]|jgi:HlyD family secretion protein|nr:HlyD family efflux transporter periplasmic adaptor subunit [Dysgonamonadaceae bacterium]